MHRNSRCLAGLVALAAALVARPAAAELDAKLLAGVQAALKAQDPARAERLLEQAYRSGRDPQILLHLGRVALAAGRQAGAADLFRRYLDTLAEGVDEPAQREINAHLGSLREPVGEVLVQAGGGGVLLVDGHLVGALPLPGPVLVGAGPHRFRVENGSRRYESDALTVPPGRQAELRLSPGAHGTAVAVLTLSPVVLPRLVGAAARILTPAVARAAADAAQREHAVLYPRDKAAALLAGRPDRCPDEPQCLSELAGEAQARALLTLRLREEGGRSVFVAELVDAPSGDVSATAEALLPPDEAGRAAAIGGLVHKVLASGLLRPRGALAIGSVPPGARITVDGQARGVTPLERASLVGRHKVQLALPGYAPYEVEVEVAAGQTAAVQATLVPPGSDTPRVMPAAGTAPTRPRWRLALGGTLLGAGALLAGFGISALAVHGGCADTTPPLPEAECDYFYSTQAVGGALLGAVLLALPPRRAARISSASPSLAVWF
jgi:hypothetical protein